MESLAVNGLCKKYGEVEALHPFNFNFCCGIYGILGENGAGKSTLMNLLTDNVKRTGGDIALDGRDILRMNREYRKHLGYMPQQNGYFDAFSVRMFLAYMAESKGLKRKRARQQITELLEKVNLLDKQDCRMDTLSGGMKRRAMLAQALLGEPDILILDEPTAGLDPKERIHIRNLILGLSVNRCILLATHVVSDIESIADQILIMKKGELAAVGTPEQLIQGISGKVWEIACEKSNIEKMLQRFPNSSIAQTQQGITFRIAGENCPDDGCPVTDRINLEDVYLYYFS